jgi:hypothetical protein
MPGGGLLFLGGTLLIGLNYGVVSTIKRKRLRAIAHSDEHGDGFGGWWFGQRRHHPLVFYQGRSRMRLG